MMITAVAPVAERAATITQRVSWRVRPTAHGVILEESQTSDGVLFRPNRASSSNETSTGQSAGVSRLRRDRGRIPPRGRPCVSRSQGKGFAPKSMEEEVDVGQGCTSVELAKLEEAILTGRHLVERRKLIEYEPIGHAHERGSSVRPRLFSRALNEQGETDAF